MSFDGNVPCECGALMRRIPQMPAVNWGQLRPSQGELHPNIKNLVDTAPQRHDEYLAKLEERAKAKAA